MPEERSLLVSAWHEPAILQVRRKRKEVVSGMRPLCLAEIQTAVSLGVGCLLGLTAAVVAMAEGYCAGTMTADPKAEKTSDQGVAENLVAAYFEISWAHRALGRASTRLCEQGTTP